MLKVEYIDSLKRIMTKLPVTSEATIGIIFLVMNLGKLPQEFILSICWMSLRRYQNAFINEIAV